MGKRLVKEKIKRLVLKNKLHLKGNNNFNYCKNIVKDFEILKHNFVLWIKGVFEDDPLPFEIRIIVFIFEYKNSFVSLNFSGGERITKKVEPLDYFPLESQCFFDSKFFNFYKKGYAFYTNKNSGNKLKKYFYFNLSYRLILNAITHNKIKEFLRKRICLGEAFKDFEDCIIIQNN